MNKKSLEFHIKSDDYFGTLATVLSLINQSMERDNINKKYTKTMNGLVRNLMYLQKGYKIIKNK